MIKATDAQQRRLQYMWNGEGERKEDISHNLSFWSQRISQDQEGDFDKTISREKLTIRFYNRPTRKARKRHLDSWMRLPIATTRFPSQNAYGRD